MKIRQFLSKTVIQVALISLLIITVVNRGNLASVDTVVRLQMAHAWWTGTEEVDPNYKPYIRGDLWVGITGNDGKRYLSYDPGQAILMLPGDWLGSQIHRLFPNSSLMDLRQAVVSYFVFVPLNIFAVLVCFWILRLMNFSETIAGMSAIAWLVCTTFLAYAQETQHNNQILLFVGLGYAGILAYINGNQKRFLVLSGVAVSAAVLIRASSIIHILTSVLFLIICTLYQNRNRSKFLQSFLEPLGVWILGFTPLVVLGRLFDYLRYGSFFITGQALSAQQFTTDPKWEGLPEFPPNYPFINPPHVGILGPLFSPIKSIFIYDPLLIPCLIIGIIFWKRLSFYIKAYLCVGLLNLGLHLLLTSKLIFWGGDLSWGARYHVTSIHLLIIPLLALLIQEAISSKGLRAWVLRSLFAIALIIQIASVTIYHGLEIDQSPTREGDLAPEVHASQFRLGQRFVNIACQFNLSIAPECKPVQMLPFRNNPAIFVWLWRVLVAIAIATTALFIRRQYRLARNASSNANAELAG